MDKHAYLVILGSLLLAGCASQNTVTLEPDPVPVEEAGADPVLSEPGLDLADPLPVDSKVRMDTLENGLVYYIRVNTEPENRAELRLAVDAGSILEMDDQLGVAHFVEHMLFNGTCRFPEQELIDFLERTGMRFGPDVNAYTSFDETVYMLQIPTDSRDLMETSFDVLQDWASCATLSSEEIDKERGVVVEEWRRSTETAQGRMRDELYELLLFGSRYAQRLPIGDPQVIRNADHETFRRFYEAWYRPDLMSIVAVGDFDPDEIETLIVERFSELEMPQQKPVRETFDVPEHGQTFYRVLSDPEMPYTGVTVYYNKEAEPEERVEDYREDLVGMLFNSILNQRFAEISRQPNSPFLGAGVMRGSIARPAEYYGLSAGVHEDSILVGLEGLVTEATRVRRHGFTETELARHVREMLRQFQQAYNERNNTSSSSYAREFVAHFLQGEPIPGIEYEFELAQRYLPTIRLEELNSLAEELLQPENRVVLVQMPEKEGLVPPTEHQLAAVIDGVAEKEIAPYVEDVSDQPLVEAPPEPAAVVSEEEHPEVGVQEFQLANGVTVVMKPTDFKEDEVRFRAFSPGGASLADEEDHFEAQLAASIVTRSGVGPFDRTALDKLLAGRVVSVSPFISDTQEGFSGTASPEDLETLFQLIHLYVEAPRADSSAFVSLQNQYRAYLLNRAADPDAAFQDTLQAALYGYHPRNRVPTTGMVDSLELATAFGIYQDRFGDLSDFTFVFVGNFDPDTVRALSQTYLGTLPAPDRQENWRDVFPDLTQDAVEKTIYRGLGERSTVSIVFTGDFDYTRENRHRIRSLGEVLRILLREELREERGGVYGVSVNASPQDAPDERYTFSISFTTDPERVDELVEAVWETVEELRQEGPPPSELEKVKEQQRRGRETDLRTNPFWVSVLDFYYSRDDEDLLDVNTYLEMTEALTPDVIQQAAREYLDEDRHVKVVHYPENYAASDGRDND